MVVNNNIGLRELHRSHKMKRRSTPNLSIQDFDQYQSVIDAYLELLPEILIKEGKVTLIGTLITVEIMRQKKEVIDQLKSKELGVIVYNFNSETFGYNAFFALNDYGRRRYTPFYFKKTVTMGKLLCKHLRKNPTAILQYKIKPVRIYETV